MLASTNHAPSITVDYSFPSTDANSSRVFDPKDNNLAKNLKLDLIAVSSPKLSSVALFKEFEDVDISEESMFMEILNDHRQGVNQYSPLSVGLKPKQSTQNFVSESNHWLKDSTTRKLSPNPKKNRGEYRSPSTSFHNTPIPNKTIFFSPSSTKKVSNLVTQSTPVGLLKEAQINKSKSNNNLLRHKLQQVQNSSQSRPQQKDNYKGDELACHAGNIMRMAIDSTLLGSTLNSSYSLHFSNCNDSLEMTPSRKRFSDIFDDEDDDNEGSLLENMLSKKRINIKNQPRARIDINDEELRAAISG